MIRPAFGTSPVTDVQILDLDILIATTTASLAGCKPPVNLNHSVTLVPDHFLEKPPATIGYRT